MSEHIELKLVETNYHIRWGCDVCGGHTEKVSVLTEGRQDLGDGESRTIRVCEMCLEGRAGLTLDQRLEQHARALEGSAEMVRGLIGRLQVPTYAEWEEAEFRVNCERNFDHVPTAAEIADFRKKQSRSDQWFGEPATSAAAHASVDDDFMPF